MTRGTWRILRRGNAILETALVVPVLLSLAFGTVEFGHFFYVNNSLQGAAREGARAAILPGATNADVTTAVNNAMGTYGLGSSGYTVTISPSDISGLAPGNTISVTVQCTWGTVGVRPMQLMSASKLIKGKAAMRRE